MKAKGIFAVILVLMVMAMSLNVFGATRSGYCGENVSWTLEDSGKLTLTGSGDMYNVPYNGDTYTSYEWIDNGYSVTSVSIGSGITGIGAYAFEALGISGSVEIPEGVTRIGMGAFVANGITSVKIPSTVTAIDMGVFYDNPLKEIYYNGSEAQWNEIAIDRENNDELFAA